MSFLKEYILSVSSAAIICSIITNSVGKKSSNTAVIKLICGVFISITIVAPWTRQHFSNLSAYWSNIAADSSNIVEHGAMLASESTATIIKDRSAAYILDKARSLNLDITVDVTLSKDDPPIPYQVTFTGNVSPYKKNELQNIISQDLGIPKENQIWN